MAELLRDCPVLFHMAERGAWPSIRRHGLLSTSALLDLYGVTGARREALERQRRPEGVRLARPGLEGAVVRDQKPMDDAGLRRCLRDGLSPGEWYGLLNARVFFWLTRARLLRLLNARPYRAVAHEVLELDAAPLVAAYRDQVTLSAINSGATRPFGVPRGRETLLPLRDYPYAAWRRTRPVGERAVELAVLGGVPDVVRFVRRVVVMRGAAEEEVLFDRRAAPAQYG